jgi:tRNA pseudouridine38-40 synthase
MNYRLTIQYDGTDFHGWQTQDKLRTVQGDLTNSLTLINGARVIVHGAGRTDAGVHAEGQVASVKLRREWAVDALRAAVNGNLGRDVRVIGASPAHEDFHARYSAKGKTYCYRVFNEKFISPLWSRYAHHEARPLDAHAMREAARLFVGRHDWTAFSAASAEVASRVRCVTRLDVSERRSGRGRGRMLEIRAEADGFLRYMVRSIAGTLMAIGRGEVGAEQITLAIETGDRRLAAATAPACGLSLVDVHY